MIRKSLLAFAILCGWPTSALAVPTITAGDHILLPNTANQKIAILISDDGQGTAVFPFPPGRIGGVDLVLTIGGGTAGPIITAIDLVGPGTIFNANNSGQHDFGEPFTEPGRETFTYASSIEPTSVSANGILAFATLSTVGIPNGVYSLSLSSDNLGVSDVAQVDPEFLPFLIDGTLHVIPEPASIVIGLMGAAALGAVVIRKRRARG